MQDGKNQESSSEAVNAYLGIVLLGQATGDAMLEGWGQLLLATEVTAARKYAQAYTGNDIYQEVRAATAVQCDCQDGRNRQCWGDEFHPETPTVVPIAHQAYSRPYCSGRISAPQG